MAQATLFFMEFHDNQLAIGVLIFSIHDCWTLHQRCSEHPFQALCAKLVLKSLNTGPCGPAARLVSEKQGSDASKASTFHSVDTWEEIYRIYM